VNTTGDDNPETKNETIPTERLDSDHIKSSSIPLSLEYQQHKRILVVDDNPDIIFTLRVGLESDPLLGDLIADSDDKISAVTFGTGFTGINEIETGPDGNLYILTFDRETEGQGSLYRILPAGEEGSSSAGVPPSVPQDTVTPPVTDESEAGAEEGAEDEVNGNNDNNNEGEDQEENSNENE
jgi:hypothetical protein